MENKDVNALKDIDAQELLKLDNDDTIIQDVPELVTVKQELLEDNHELTDPVVMVKEEPREEPMVVEIVKLETVKLENQSKSVLEDYDLNKGTIKAEGIDIKTDENDERKAVKSETESESHLQVLSIKPEEIDIKTEEGDESTVSSGIIQRRCEEATDQLSDQCLSGTSQGNSSKGKVQRKRVKGKTSAEGKVNCDPKTPRKRNLKEHSFQCNVCDYKTSRKQDLQRHSLKHKNPEELHWFQCDHCDYKTLQKGNLNRHLLGHENNREWYQCDLCDYKTVRIDYLKTHSFRHKNPEQFKCNICDYQGIQKQDLKRHLVTHKKPKELVWYQCDLCDYKTLQDRFLKIHLLRHKKLNDEPVWLQCAHCDYKTIHKHSLKTHSSRCRVGNAKQAVGISLGDILHNT